MRIRLGLTMAVLAITALAGAAQAGPTLLFEAASGKILYAEDPDNQWHPASLTKIMTAYVVFGALNAGKLTLETKIPCSETAAAQAPSKVGLPAGGELTVELALKALIIKSANDVAVMLAEAVGGTVEQFVEQMNATAKRLGMTRTRFINPNGLPAAEQVTTARDLAKLSRAVLRDFPQFAPYWAMPEMHIGTIQLSSHNSLLKSFEGADGLKTGFICDSGFNVVASATRDGRKLMAVVLGETSGAERSIRAAGLLEHGFQSYGWKSLFASSTIDTLSMSPDAKGLATMRDAGVKWECGARKQAKRVAKAKAAKGGKAAGAAGSAAVSQTGADGAAAKPKPKPKPKAAAATASTAAAPKAQ